MNTPPAAFSGPNTASSAPASRRRSGKSDITVELLRIIGLCLVIGTHSKQSFFINEVPNYTRALMGAVTGDGVAVFWTILGFFMYSGPSAGFSYSSHIKKTARRILVPMAVFSVFMFYFSGVLLDGMSLAESLRRPLSAYKELLTGLLRWENAAPYCGHFWYLYVYMLIALCIPVFWGIFRFLDKTPRYNTACLTAIFAALVLNDLFKNQLFHFSHYRFGGMLGAAVFIIAGHILYQRRNRFLRNIRCGIAGIAVCAGINLLRAFVQYRCFLADPKNTLPVFWFTSFSFINVIGILMIAWGFSGFYSKERVSGVVRYLGRQSFLMYIIHYMILQTTRNLGVTTRLNAVLGNRWYGTILYELIYIVLIYALSLLLAAVISAVLSLPGRIRLRSEAGR